MTTIQAPEVTDDGVAAVVARLQAYSAGISGMVASLPPETSNGATIIASRGGDKSFLPKTEHSRQ